MLRDYGKLNEYAWWYLYIQVINERNELKKEQFDLIESLLPWINPELYSKVKEKEKTKENVFYSKQMQDVMSGNFDPEDDSIPDINSAFGASFDVKSLFEKQNDKDT